MVVLIIVPKLSFTLLSLFLCACISTPKLNIEGVDRTLTPIKVQEDFHLYQSNKVIWGGIIVNSKNLKEGTLLEVLAYPLSFNEEPDTNRKPLERFRVEHPEYLETMNYSSGRLITVIGPLIELQKDFIGETKYTYPVIAAEQLHLWPIDEQQSDTQFYFGVGVGFTIIK